MTDEEYDALDQELDRTYPRMPRIYGLIIAILGSSVLWFIGYKIFS